MITSYHAHTVDLYTFDGSLAASGLIISTVLHAQSSLPWLLSHPSMPSPRLTTYTQSRLDSDSKKTPFLFLPNFRIDIECHIFWVKNWIRFSDESLFYSARSLRRKEIFQSTERQLRVRVGRAFCFSLAVDRIAPFNRRTWSCVLSYKTDINGYAASRKCVSSERT